MVSNKLNETSFHYFTAETKVITNREAITGIRAKGTSAVKSSDDVSGSVLSSSSSSHHDLAAILQNYNRTSRVRSYNPDIRQQFNSATTLLRFTPISILKAFLPFLLIIILKISSSGVGSTLL